MTMNDSQTDRTNLVHNVSTDAEENGNQVKSVGRVRIDNSITPSD